MADTPMYAAMTSEALYSAIDTAENVETLGDIWAALEPLGWSRDGLLYGRILERRAELGDTLTDEEQAMAELAALRRERGRQMAPITGRGRR